MIGIRLILTYWTSEHFAPLFFHPRAIAVREPLSLGATFGAILGCPVGVHFDGDEPLCIIFVFRVLVDLAAQLVGLAAVHAPRLAAPPTFDLAQPLKEQHTGWVCGAHRGDDARHLVGGILVHAPHMCPHLLIAVLAFDRFAG